MPRGGHCCKEQQSGRFGWRAAHFTGPESDKIGGATPFRVSYTLDKLSPVPSGAFCCRFLGFPEGEEYGPNDYESDGEIDICHGIAMIP